MESYEVIIIGVGPAGLACARKLAELNLPQFGEKGKRILLLEKNSVIGPKVCAGGIPSFVVDHFKLPEELWDFKFDEITFHTPLQSRALKLEGPFYTINRRNLGQWQLRKLENTNVKVRVNARATKIEKDHIIINDSEKIQYKYLVGADGANSSVRKFLGLRTKKFLLAVQYIIPTDAYKKIEVFFYPELIDMGYIWIFPHKGYVSIGCGTEPGSYSSKELVAGFEKWLKLNKIDVSKGKFEAFTINYDYQGYRSGNIFLVGDAAGLAAGLTGGGIYQALLSGEEIAKAIADEKYVSNKMKELLLGNKKQNATLWLMEKSKIFLRLEMELFLLILKSKWLSKHLVRKMM
ncbi:MAG: NAD(P)/FAD-dependent oxidoreductase [Minisyncoccia bacterium]